MSRRSSAVVVIFDIDGTLLIDSASTHLRAFADALTATTGHPDPFTRSEAGFFCAGTPVSGRIDSEIVRMCLEWAGVPPSEVDALAPVMMEETVLAYRSRIARGEPAGTTVPGVVAVLEELRARGVACGLVTGNARLIALTKLSACGLGDRFCFGGFGDEGPRRSALFARALDEAAAVGIDHPQVCYVGDTPLDVSAAGEAAVSMVAVATGRFDRATLERAGATTVLDRYTAIEPACDLLIGCARQPGCVLAGPDPVLADAVLVDPVLTSPRFSRV